MRRLAPALAPLSLTAISTLSSTRRVVTVRLPPCDSASSPFLIRLRTAWRSRERSIAIGGTEGSVSALRVMPCREASGRTKSMSADTMSFTESSSN